VLAGLEASAEEAMSEADISTEQPEAGQEARVPPPDVDASRAGGPARPTPQGPRSALRLIWRVERRELFLALRSGRRGRSGPLTATHVPGDPAVPSRVAFAVGRRVGDAVDRNRVRRRLRALVREPAMPLHPGLYLIAAGPGAIDATFDELRRDLTEAIRRSQTTGTRATSGPATDPEGSAP
jgi:ribonuclease P protein component